MQDCNNLSQKNYPKHKTLKQSLYAMMLALLCSNTADAFTPEEGKHYKVLPEKVESALISPKGVVEFFAFGCPNCYAFEYQYKVPEKINHNITHQPVQYISVDALANAPDLTQAWAFTEVASRMLNRPQAKEMVKQALFEGFKHNAIKSATDVQQILLSVFKITEEAFFALWDSNEVVMMTAEQINLTKKLKIDATPTLLVNGKYLVTNSGFKEAGNVETFMDWYLQTIQFLFDKKD